MAFARKLNDWVAGEVVAARPDRFRAFATLPLCQPEAAVDELERSVREHGFVGCMSYGPIDGRFLDHADFMPLLARAEALAVPTGGSAMDIVTSSRCPRNAHYFRNFAHKILMDTLLYSSGHSRPPDRYRPNCLCT